MKFTTTFLTNLFLLLFLPTNVIWGQDNIELFHNHQGFVLTFNVDGEKYILSEGAMVSTASGTAIKHIEIGKCMKLSEDNYSIEKAKIIYPYSSKIEETKDDAIYHFSSKGLDISSKSPLSTDDNTIEEHDIMVKLPLVSKKPSKAFQAVKLYCCDDNFICLLELKSKPFVVYKSANNFYIGTANINEESILLEPQYAVIDGKEVCSNLSLMKFMLHKEIIEAKGKKLTRKYFISDEE